MGRGLGAGAAPGGGLESLRDTEQKTVGPSRVKKREFAGPRSVGTLTEIEIWNAR